MENHTVNVEGTKVPHRLYIVRRLPTMLIVGSIKAVDAEDAEETWLEAARANDGPRYQDVIATFATPDRLRRLDIYLHEPEVLATGIRPLAVG